MKKILISFDIDMNFEYMSHNTSSKDNSLFDKWNEFLFKIIFFMANGRKYGNSKVLSQHLHKYKTLT